MWRLSNRVRKFQTIFSAFQRCGCCSSYVCVLPKISSESGTAAMGKTGPSSLPISVSTTVVPAIVAFSFEHNVVLPQVFVVVLSEPSASVEYIPLLFSLRMLGNSRLGLLLWASSLPQNFRVKIGRSIVVFTAIMALEVSKVPQTFMVRVEGFLL